MNKIEDQLFDIYIKIEKESLSQEDYIMVQKIEDQLKKQQKIGSQILIFLGSIYGVGFNEFLCGIFYFNKSLKIAKQEKNIKDEIQSRIMLGTYYTNLGLYEQSITYISPLIHQNVYRENIDDQSYCILAYQLMTNYIRMDKQVEVNQMIEFIRAIPSKNHEGIYFFQKLSESYYAIYNQSNDYGQLRETIEACEKLYKNLKKRIINIEMILYKFRGILEERTERYEIALCWYQKGLNKCLRRGDDLFIIEFNQLLSNIYEKFKQYDEALAHYKEAYSIKIGSKTMQKEKYMQFLMRYYDVAHQHQILAHLVEDNGVLDRSIWSDRESGLPNRLYFEKYIYNKKYLVEGRSPVAIFFIEFSSKKQLLENVKALKRQWGDIWIHYKERLILGIWYNVERHQIIEKGRALTHTYETDSERIYIGVTLFTQNDTLYKNEWMTYVDEALIKAKKQPSGIWCSQI